MADTPDPYDLEPKKDGETPEPRIDKPSLLGDDEEGCPKCSAALQPDAVMCVKCGYDLSANVVRTAETGVDEIAVDQDDEEPETAFVVAGKVGARVLLAIGGVLTLTAVVGAGLLADGGTIGNALRSSFLSFHSIALHTGTGIAAVMIIAWLSEQRSGPVDVIATRMFVAFSLFEATRVCVKAAPEGHLYAIVVAAALYLGVMWLLFKKTGRQTLLIGLAHGILYLFVTIGSDVAPRPIADEQRTDAAREVLTLVDAEVVA